MKIIWVRKKENNCFIFEKKKQRKKTKKHTRKEEREKEKETS